MSLRKHIKVSLAAGLLWLASSAAAAEVVLVVSPKNPVANLSATQVFDIFLGRAAHFPNGMPAVPVDRAEGSDERDAFYQNFAGRSPAQIKAHWSKIIFTGKGHPPRQAESAERVKRLIAENPAFIGYIERAEADASVKIVPISN